MQHADGWFICRVGFIETLRAVSLAGGGATSRAFRQEWSAFGVIEVDERLAEDAARLTLEHGLRSLDALHLVAALVLPPRGLTFARWDQRLHAGAEAEGLTVLPDDVPALRARADTPRKLRVGMIAEEVGLPPIADLVPVLEAPIESPTGYRDTPPVDAVAIGA